MTMMAARTPNTKSAMITVTQNAGPWPFSVLKITRSTV